LPSVRSLLTALVVSSAALPCWADAIAAPLSQEIAIGVGFVWTFAGLLIAIAVHETGHLACALVTGTPVRLVSVGAGPLLFRHRLHETWFELRLLPTLGFVTAYPAAVIHRGRLALFLLGGVLANTAAIAGIAIFVAWRPGAASADDVIGAIVFAQLWLMLVNLAPFSVRIGNRRIGSDGRQLWQLLSLKSGEPTAAGTVYAQLIANYAGSQAPPTFTPASARIIYHVSHADRWRSPATAREFVDALFRELERGSLPAAEEAFVIDALLTYALARGDAALRPRLDALSERALTLAPSATLSGSRGAVLVEIGRYGEGKSILERVIAQDGLSPFDAFMTEAHLARAELGLGDHAAAARWATAARRSAATCTTPATPLVLARLEMELAAGRREVKAGPIQPHLIPL